MSIIATAPQESFMDTAKLCITRINESLNPPNFIHLLNNTPFILHGEYKNDTACIPLTFIGVHESQLLSHAQFKGHLTDLTNEIRNHDYMDEALLIILITRRNSQPMLALFSEFETLNRQLPSIDILARMITCTEMAKLFQRQSFQ
ncbi:hypothetical protein J8L98_12675 [Pseudoalteromonas sp. MMG013]|uniref:hypothetical protein n=1 Tax=Pseudoalteromonas sp. MMG013 TaxID=2822687 RepID=UPI001B368902|nr:hypothetical protein [Pseudoalteromonas sp. MMG013]MBQ4862542.1 hypothetical protein [Pseudoalteromonas sp. MMG013]